MRMPRQPIRFLSPEEMDTIHRNACRILETVGMKILHHDALDYLKDVGCTVDRDRQIVRFPIDVTERYVAKLRHDYADRQSPQAMAVRYSHVRFRHEPLTVHEDFTVNAGGYNAFIYDLNGVRRSGSLADTRDALKLVAQLDQVTYSGIPCAAHDVPLAIRPIRMAAELVKHTSKLGGIEALTPFDVEYITRIAEIVRGGPEALRRDPCLVGYAEVRTPLTIDGNMCDILIEYVRRGLPQSMDTMPNAGATAPMHPAGALTLGIAETLGGLVLINAIDEDAVVTIDVTPGFSDMSTGLFKYAGAERTSLLGARIQMISDYYGCPSGVHGCKTDACAPDIRAGVEKGISMIVPILCGAVGVGTIGQIENAVTYSPAQLVIDNEIARYVRRAIQGFDVTDATIDVDLIARVGHDGNYMEQPETLEQFRDVLNLSPFFRTEPWGSAPGIDQAKRMENLAHDRARELLANDVESPLTPDQIAAIDDTVAEAEVTLRQRGML